MGDYSEERLYLKLCEMLGYTRKELLNKMSSEEITLWIEELKIRNQEQEKAYNDAKSKGKKGGR
jgi:hypothetical protein